MADTDILSALLSSGAGSGSGGGTDAGELGALEAYQNSPFLQGRTSQSGPLGQISQAIMPILASKIYGDQAAKQQEADKVKTLVSVLSLVKELKGANLADAKTQAELKKLGIENDILGHVHDLHGAVNGEGYPAGTKLSVGGLSIPLGAEKPSNNEIGLLREANPNATPQELLGALSKQRQSEISADAMARVPAAVEEARQKQALIGTKLKPLTPADASEYANFATSIKSMDEAIDEFASGKVTKADVLKSSLSGGLLSNPTLRKYATFYNDVAQSRFKSRVTQAEMTRLSQELPPPTSYLADPEKFVESLNLARAHAADKINKKLTYESKSYDIPDELKHDIMGLSPASDLPSGAASGKSQDIVIPNEKAAEVGQMIEKLKKTHTQEETMKIMRELYGE